MQQSSVTAFGREISRASGRQRLEERSTQAASLMRDFQEWIEAVSLDEEGDTRSAAMHNDLAQHYISLIDQTFKDLVRADVIAASHVECRAAVPVPFRQEEAGRLKRVA